MDRKQACETLRIKDDHPDPKTVIKAFTRLSRRYPGQHFPEKFADLLVARDTLCRPDQGFREVLFDDEINLSFLKSALKETTSKPKISTEEKCLQDFLRPVYPYLINQDSMAAGDDFSEVQASITRMLEELGPDEVQRILEKLENSPY